MQQGYQLPHPVQPDALVPDRKLYDVGSGWIREEECGADFKKSVWSLRYLVKFDKYKILRYSKRKLQKNYEVITKT